MSGPVTSSTCHLPKTDRQTSVTNTCVCEPPMKAVDVMEMKAKPNTTGNQWNFTSRDGLTRNGVSWDGFNNTGEADISAVSKLVCERTWQVQTAYISKRDAKPHGLLLCVTYFVTRCVKSTLLLSGSVRITRCNAAIRRGSWAPRG